MSTCTINLWTVYFNPIDAPSKYVARQFHTDQPTNIHIVCDTIGEARTWIRKQAKRYGGEPVNIGRSNQDESTIVEVWV